MKSKIFVFTTLILVVFLFVITSCDNFLNAKNKTTININLDLSKILKTSRNETTTSITDYILKVFAYNAATYKPEDEIQNLPLLTQSENKVDINGNVKASLDIEIGLNVIFVAKLYQGKSEKPLYAGKSEVIKIKATNNKVHLVLTSENTDLDIDLLIHEHTFAQTGQVMQLTTGMLQPVDTTLQTAKQNTHLATGQQPKKPPKKQKALKKELVPYVDIKQQKQLRN